MENKRIALINSVQQGGSTYLGYLVPFVRSFVKLGINFTFYNMPDRSGISNESVQQIIGNEVFSAEMRDIPFLNADLVLSNDAYIGRLFDDHTESIFVTHGTSPMPISDPYYCSGWTAYWDGLICTSTTGIRLGEIGLSEYRKDRKKLKIPTPQDALRSNLRSTCFYQLAPLKVERLFDLAPTQLSGNDSAHERDRLIVGLLPSDSGIAKENSLYRNLSKVCSEIKNVVPYAKLILRPYPSDFSNPEFWNYIENNKFLEQLEVDDPKIVNDVFFSRCDLVVTDVSTGGVSFMIRRGRPVIFFLPKLGDTVVERFWYAEMQGSVFISTSTKDLHDQLVKAVSMSTDEYEKVAIEFANKEFMMENEINDFVSSFIADMPHDGRPFTISRVSSSGEVSIL
jgi:hypothetical protein